MLTKLKQIYQDKMIESVSNYDTEHYYYFYKNNKQSDIFAVRKDITNNEYRLILANFMEKKIYSSHSFLQNIYEYILENKEYPFKHTMRIIMFTAYSDELDGLLHEIYAEVYAIDAYNLKVVFVKDNCEINLEELINPISYDLSIQGTVHNGIYVNASMEGSVVSEYITYIKNYLVDCHDTYFDFVDPLLKTQHENNSSYASFLKKWIISPLFVDPLLKDIVITYFKNDLNVSQTAKTLYINRNTLLNKLDIIFKKTGLNLQKFSHACAAYLLMNE